VIELVHLAKRFDGRPVLDDVSLRIERGETFVIIGMSGTGKTVTLKHIAGLLDPDEGEVRIDGETMSGADDATRERLRRIMGIVFQSGALINWLSVFDNIALPLRERRYSPAEIDAMVDEKLQILGLSEAKFKMPADLSGGMKKRVCLARVLVRNPSIILYDEPTAGLDPVMSHVINMLIRRMKDEFNVTQVVVTHDMQSAYEIADRIAMLYQGRIIACDVPQRIRETDHPIVRQFITGAVDGPIEVE